MSKELILAIPKGRILKDLSKLLLKTDLKIEDEFFDDNSRKLLFSSNVKNLKVIKIRSFDIANFVRLGAADIAICGFDVLEEFSSNQIYPLLDLDIGKCRLSIATDNLNKKDFQSKSHVQIATKYVNIATRYFANLGIQTEAIKLNEMVNRHTDIYKTRAVIKTKTMEAIINSPSIIQAIESRCRILLILRANCKLPLLVF